MSQAPSNFNAPRPRFSVVVPTYQRRELVVALVASLESQIYDKPFEVIVVVDGSSDGTSEVLRNLSTSFPLIVHEQPNQGAAAARNAGAAKAAGEILLFLDDDMAADPRLLAQHERSHLDGANVVLGHMALHPGSPRSFLTAGVELWANERRARLMQSGAVIRFDDVLTGQISISSAFFRELHGFDTAFTRDGEFGNEDIDFGERIIRSGGRVAFNADAITWQTYVVTPDAYVRRWREVGRADVVFARKHPQYAAEVFRSSGGDNWLLGVMCRWLAALPAVATLLSTTISDLAIRLVTQSPDGLLSRRVFKVARALQYWQGVKEAGGIPRRRAVRILAFHSIGDLRGARVLEPYAVPPETFAGQIDTLTRARYVFITPDEFARYLGGDAGLPSNPVLLTFDDCFQDFYRNGLPILHARGLSAVAFAVAGCVGGENRWDEALGAPQLRLMTAEELRDAARAGIEIGSHTCTHRDLTGLNDVEVWTEIDQSLEDLERDRLRRPRFLAYPYGCHDRRSEAAARSSGVVAAFTVRPGLFRDHGDPMRVPRIEILRHDTGWRLLWKVGVAPRLRW